MDVGARVGQIRQINAKIKEIEKQQEAILAPFRELAERMKNEVLAFLNQTGQQNAKTKQGTAYKYERVSYRIEDIDQFKRHIIGSAEWDAINWAVNKTAADDRFAKTKELFPGVTRSVDVTLGVLAPPKPKEKKAKAEENETVLSDEDWAEILDSPQQEAAE